MEYRLKIRDGFLTSDNKELRRYFLSSLKILMTHKSVKITNDSITFIETPIPQGYERDAVFYTLNSFISEYANKLSLCDTYYFDEEDVETLLQKLPTRAVS